MIRKIIKIDETVCNGCGLCISSCHEGAIGLVNGKAKLLREDYCDGLGDCLPACPIDAITFEEREAPAYNKKVLKMAKQATPSNAQTHSATNATSQLYNWPVQIKLAPVRTPYYNVADLLIAADCTAYVYGNFHNDFICNRVTLIGCPKLDAIDYSIKLASILAENDINSITVVRMEVPCCGGIEFAVKNALENSGKDIPIRIVTISTEGKIIN